MRLLLFALTLILYLWPFIIVQEHVTEIQRTYTNSSCYPTTRDDDGPIECYPKWRSLLFNYLEGLFLRGETLEKEYFLWSLVEGNTTITIPHWHFYQTTKEKDDAEAWVQDFNESTCSGHFIAHRMSFAEYGWSLLAGRDKGPIVGVYLHIM